MTTVYLARHGESDWNAENRFQGRSDRALTERGRGQAEALAEALASTPLDGVYASPLRRALETAEIVAARQGLDPVPVADLSEIDVGGWAGLSRAEVETRFPERFQRWLGGGEGWADGETYERMAARVLSAVRLIAEKHPDGNVLVVTHGGPMRAIHAVAHGMDLHAYRLQHRVEPNARLSAVAVEDGKITRLD